MKTLRHATLYWTGSDPLDQLRESDGWDTLAIAIQCVMVWILRLGGMSVKEEEPGCLESGKVYQPGSCLSGDTFRAKTRSSGWVRMGVDTAGAGCPRGCPGTNVHQATQTTQTQGASKTKSMVSQTWIQKQVENWRGWREEGSHRLD